ncbi:MAG: hypothetical protein GY863_22170, partial [bacterium]|nr:hypothetical protein [bacterium]
MKNNGNIYPLPVIDPDIIDNNDCFILFESGKPNSVDHRSYVFSDPEEIILVSRYEDIPEAFDRIEKYSLDHYMAGYFSYELGYYFEEKFSPPPEISIPLVKMAVFPEAAVFDHYTGKTSSWNRLISEKKDVHRDYKTGTLKANITRDDYYSAVNVIKQHVEKGDIYQANFTFMNRFDFSGCPYTFYRDLLCGQPVAYSSFMKFSDEYILSLSPELFFRIKDNVIESKPMKGTIKRGLDTAEDKKQ